MLKTSYFSLLPPITTTFHLHTTEKILLRAFYCNINWLSCRKQFFLNIIIDAIVVLKYSICVRGLLEVAEVEQSVKWLDGSEFGSTRRKRFGYELRERSQHSAQERKGSLRKPQWAQSASKPKYETATFRKRPNHLDFATISRIYDCI
jgi:hypothetical protein